MKPTKEINNQLKTASEKLPIDSNFYWLSNDAKKLFNPLSHESVMECLVRRDAILAEAVTDDELNASMVGPASPIQNDAYGILPQKQFEDESLESFTGEVKIEAV